MKMLKKLNKLIFVFSLIGILATMGCTKSLSSDESEADTSQEGLFTGSIELEMDGNIINITANDQDNIQSFEVRGYQEEYSDSYISLGSVAASGGSLASVLTEDFYLRVCVRDKNNNLSFLSNVLKIATSNNLTSLSMPELIQRTEQWGSSKEYFLAPSGVAADDESNIYLVDSFSFRIIKFDNWSNHIASGFDDFAFQKRPRSVAIKDSYVYTIDDSKTIIKFDLDGNKEAEFDATAQLKEPRAIVLDDAGNIYIADKDAGKIYKYDSSGVFQESYGRALGWVLNYVSPGDLARPRGLAIDDTGKIYVTDKDNIQVLDPSVPEWSLVTSVNASLLDYKQLRGISLDEDGNIYVANSADDDIADNVLLKYSPTGTFLGKIPVAYAPQYILINSNDLYLTRGNKDSSAGNSCGLDKYSLKTNAFQFELND
ncbi:MAG: hypothetical protein GY730_05000 [bacterium]|nr:hypothetical protein [bacterium]